jgi:hypothetical protein
VTSTIKCVMGFFSEPPQKLVSQSKLSILLSAKSQTNQPYALEIQTLGSIWTLIFWTRYEIFHILFNNNQNFILISPSKTSFIQMIYPHSDHRATSAKPEAYFLEASRHTFVGGEAPPPKKWGLGGGRGSPPPRPFPICRSPASH